MGGKGTKQEGQGTPTKTNIHEGHSELDRPGSVEKDRNSSAER